jgi:hypothetical protein
MPNRLPSTPGGISSDAVQVISAAWAVARDATRHYVADRGGAPMTFVKQQQVSVGRRACCLGAWRRGRRCGGGRGR